MLPIVLAAGMLGQPSGAAQWPIHVYCSTGDHLWVAAREPVDSPAAVTAMVEWMAETYGVRRLYWRGGGEEIWSRYYRFGADTPYQYDGATNWERSLFREQRLNEATVSAAHRTGMEVYLYTGLFEHGVQPDVGIIAPYLIEDTLRIEHPEWCMLDRWGERRCPGPLSLAYPQVRAEVIRRFVEAIDRFGYDGITFYTYVENVGLRYPDEFEFNEPVIARFRERYPEVDPRAPGLTEEQRAHWRHCRGELVTQFLRELHAALAAEGKRVMIILDAANPDVPQPWWSKPTAGTGPIRLDWEAWITEGIVDAIWVQLAAPEVQRAALDRVLAARGDHQIEVVVRAVDPWHEAWAPYVAAGVVPVAVITAPVNGIERVTLPPTSPQTLDAEDWKLRAQTLADIAGGRLVVSAAEVARLAGDPHLLVRRRALHALAELGDPAQVAVIERALDDPESCVRIAAAVSLGSLHGTHSATRLLDGVARHPEFQVKQAAVASLEAMGAAARSAVVEGLSAQSAPVREVCVRALYRLGRGGLAAEAFEPLSARALDPAEDDVVRYWAIQGAVGLRLEIADQPREQFAAGLIDLLDGQSSPMVEQRAAEGLGHLAASVSAATRARSLVALERLLRTYGDGCSRPDAAYGWRLVGNAILQHDEPGRAALETMRAQTRDRWLAWIAYEVAHVPQRRQTMELVDEAEAIAIHDRLAPAFPGWRSW